MRLAVLSGKGGTGKTLVSVNLASVAGPAVYIDCDVEEPNGHLFFKPVSVQVEPVFVKIPDLDGEKCNGCRKCVEFCQFNALAFVNKKPYLFESVCHSCGGCSLLCPQGALMEKDRAVGEIQTGVSGDVRVYTGMMYTGEESGVPIIKKLLGKEMPDAVPTIIDCPPGSACTVMESIKDADYCILTAEPTVFGSHNLAMVYELVRLFNKPHGVVLNKCLDGENPSEQFCLEHNIKILGKIPFDTQLGDMNAQAMIVARENDYYRDLFSDLLKTVTEEVRYEAVANPQR